MREIVALTALGKKPFLNCVPLFAASRRGNRAPDRRSDKQEFVSEALDAHNAHSQGVFLKFAINASKDSIDKARLYVGPRGQRAAQLDVVGDFFFGFVQLRI